MKSTMLMRPSTATEPTTPTGRPWLGVNFWSRAGGPRMWTERYDGGVVREELAVLAAHGCNVTRSFCSWPELVPEPERLDPAVLARFADFLDAHAEHGLATVPTLLVGHMSGENRDPVWREGRDLYRDVRLVAGQAWLAEELAARFDAHPAVAGWLVSNEMPLYGGPAPEEDVTAWARLVVSGLRAGGARKPVSLGDGAWGVETTGRDNGFSLRALAPLVDFVGPHVYPMGDDEPRQLLAAAFACELAGGFGRPVVLEEFGATSDFASDEHIAAYYRQVLHTTLAAGARGWLAWCNTDFDGLRDEDPYRHHPFELHFGVTDASGRPKPQLAELERFSRLVRRLAGSGFGRLPAGVRLVVPEHFERVLPFTEQAYRDDIAATLLQAYVAAREADLPVEPARERDGLPDGARLYLLPSAKLVTAPGLDRLGSLAAGGATVYASYFAGSTPVQRGPWLSLGGLFGVRHTLRYGLVDPIEDDEVTLELVSPLGGLAPGARLSFHVAGEPSARSFLPAEPAGAEVLAVDGRGRPALFRRRHGAGAAILCAYPLEYMAARTPRANPEHTWLLYAALADEAGVERPVRVDDPRVAVARLAAGDGELAILANLSPDAVELEPVLADGYELELPDGRLSLDPYGVAVSARVSARGGPPLAAAVAAPAEGRDAPA